LNTFPLWVGFRYTRSNNQQRFLSLLSWLSLFGMMLGVAALIIVMSVMNGFQQEMQQRLLKVIPDIVISEKGFSSFNYPDLSPSLSRFTQSEALPISIKPFVGGDALLQAYDQAQAIQLKAVETQVLTELSQQGRNAHFNFSPEQLAQTKYPIVLGEVLATRLQLEVGDKVKLTLPMLSITPFGAKPRSKRFTVAAIFSSGSEQDIKAAFIPLGAGQKLYKLKDEQVHGVELRFQHKSSAADKPNTLLYAKRLQEALDTLSVNYKVKPWQESHQALYQAVKMEQFMVAFMLSLVVAVAAFNLIALLSMMVSSKRADIAVLQMMGMTPTQAVAIFLTQGMALALVSMVLGLVLGILVALNISDIVQNLEAILGVYLFDPSVFYITGLPSSLQWSQVALVIIFTLLLSFVFCAYPAWRASKIKAVEALAYF